MSSTRTQLDNTGRHSFDLTYRYDYVPKEIDRIKTPSKPQFIGIEQGLVKKSPFANLENNFNTSEIQKDSGKVIFADVYPSTNDNDDMQIKIVGDEGIFTKDNKSKLKGAPEGNRGTYDLFFELKDDGASSKTEYPIDLGDKGRYTLQDNNTKIGTYTKFKKIPLLSPFFSEGRKVSGEELQGTDEDGKKWTMVWRDVTFPTAGKYTLKLICDDDIEVKIGNKTIKSIKGPINKYKKFTFSINKAGKKDITLILRNSRSVGATFKTNPVSASVIITTKLREKTGDTKSWKKNPMCVSALLIPPPCKREQEGKGVIEKVPVIVPGNGFPTGISTTITPVIPVTVKLTSINIPNLPPGTPVRIVGPPGPPITTIAPGPNISINPPIPVTSQPAIFVDQPYFGPPPQLTFDIIRDPLDVPPEQLIQVTDLVGVKQTGYYKGRPYYGAVFFKDGIRYAGYFETAGELIRIYDTLQESITEEVTTRPSAILRQGTDVTTNDPTLNIPGTPQNLI